MGTPNTLVTRPGRRRDVVVDGRRLAFLDTGGDGPVCVLVHGLAANWDYWTPTLPALTPTHRVIAVDLPGFGRSEAPDRAGIDGMVQALQGLLDLEGIAQADLIGHSMGTMVCSELAARRPDRIRRVILTGGPTLSVLDLPNHPVRTLRSRPEVASFVVEALTAGIRPPRPVRDLIVHRRWARRLAFKAYVPEPEAIDQDYVEGVLDGAGAPAVLPTLYGRWWRNYDLRATLRQVQAPVLILGGECDTIVPAADVDEALELIPGDVEARVLPGAGHWLMAERADEFNAAVAGFLSEFLSGGAK